MIILVNVGVDNSAQESIDSSNVRSSQFVEVSALCLWMNILSAKVVKYFFSLDTHSLVVIEPGFEPRHSCSEKWDLTT